MSLPPSSLRVKRKRGEAPVEALQIEHYNDDEHYNDGHDHNKKKPRNTTPGSEAWIFQRVSEGDDAKENEVKQPVSAQQNSWGAKIPVVKATQPGDELRGCLTPSKGKSEAKSSLDHNMTSPIMPADSAVSSPQTIPRRRFHLTRATKALPRTPELTNGKRKSRSVVTFMERHPNSSRATKKGHKVKQTRKPRGPQIPAEDVTAIQDLSVGTAIPERTLKRPGRNASKILKSASLAAMGGADYGSEEYAAEMQRFSLATMAQDAAGRSQEPFSMATRSIVLSKKSEQKYKPKPPAQRYNERHAAEVLSKQVSNGNQEGDEHTDTEDESDYVTDTYIRVPAHTLQIVPADLGILVIENDEEMDEFYEYDDDSDDDSDLFDDEIDENAENNPNNEYPDEEVDSDDELNINAYKYRNNGSDDEEFDLDEISHSDDGNDLPWKQPVWGKQKKPAWEVDDDISDS